MSGIAAGIKGQASRRVQAGDLASAYGNPGVEVLSSMTLMTLLEQAALAALEGSLAPDELCVGGRMEMDHLAPTPPGFTVTASAELSEVKGAKLVFAVSAHDGVEQVARGRHVRYVVDRERFLAGIKRKAARAAH